VYKSLKSRNDVIEAGFTDAPLAGKGKGKRGIVRALPVNDELWGRRVPRGPAGQPARSGPTLGVKSLAARVKVLAKRCFNIDLRPRRGAV